jgi:O-antigen/teichoic acid export membrane protein
MTATKTSTLRLQLGKQASVYFVGLGFGRGLFLLTQILLAQLLGAAGYGLYSLGFSLVLLVQWVAAIGLDWGVLRYCALYHQRGSEPHLKGTLRISLILGLASSLLLAGILLGLSEYLALRVFGDAELKTALQLFALSLPFLVLVRIATSFIQSLREIYRMTMLQHVVQPGVNFLALLALFFLGWGLAGAVGAYLVSLLVTLGLGLHYIRQTFPAFFSSLPSEFRLGELLRYSLALTFIGVSYQVLLRTPNLMLGYLADAREVGLYSAGANFAMAMAFFHTVFVMPFMPVLVELYEKGNMEQLRQVYRTVTRWTASAVLPLFLVLGIFHEPIMGLAGREFREGGLVLVLLSMAWLLYFVKGPGAALLDMTGRQTVDLVNMLGIEALTIVLNLLLIPGYGALGAAMGTTAAMLVWTVVEGVEVRILYGIAPWSATIVRQFLIAGVAGVVGYLLAQQLHWMLAAGVMLGVYILPFFAYCLEPEDRELLQMGWMRVRETLARPRTAVS